MLPACPTCRRPLTPSDPPASFCPFCGRPLRTPAGESTIDHSPDPPTLPPDLATAAAAAPPPASIGGYRLLRPLGQGGMGTVYEAEEPSGGRRVAIKLIRPEYASTPDALERFRREGRLASTIAHPRCVFVHAAEEEAGHPYLVLELMPGRTLDHLVRERGPLPADEAVRHLLDVLDGLSAAHRVGVVHRDVKPSNCFLGADGRVKLGDFGLSKSLLGAAPGDRPVGSSAPSPAPSSPHGPGKGELTRAGAFLGTPLYAAPEQVRGDSVDARTDLYAAAATLYYLLAGRAPFEGDDPAATLARIVSEPPPPLRALRPALPRRLERVVLRGLERDRRRRHRDLDEFRRALLPFVPVEPSPALPGRRLAAFLTDWALFLPLWFLLDVVFLRWVFGLSVPPKALSVSLAVLWPLYFLVSEGAWGGSPGKRLFRLRVCGGSGAGPPGWRPVLMRTAVFFGAGWPAEWYGAMHKIRDGGSDGAFLGFLCLHALGLLVVLAPMRRRNGYRGLHDRASGTRVASLPAAEERARFPLTAPAPPPDTAGGGRVGPFAVRGTPRPPCVLRGEDTALGREVLVWLRPEDGTGSGARPAVTRATRLRWLAGGRQDGARWDAFVAPPGTSLAALAAAGRRLRWLEARQLLEELAAELAEAEADGTLPAVLTPEQVWLLPDGQVQLHDVPPDGRAEPAPDPPRPLDLLARAAVLALEGRPRRPGDRGPVRAPVPPHAAAALARLVGTGPPFRDAAEFAVALAATRDLPRRVTRARRAASLTSWAAVNGFGLGLMLLVSGLAPAFVHFGVLVSQFPILRDIPDRLRVGADHALAIAAVQPGPPSRLGGVAQWEADQSLADRAETLLARRQEEEQAAAKRLPAASRALVQTVRGGADAWKEESPDARRPVPPAMAVARLRTDGRTLTAFLNADAREAVDAVGVVLALALTAWPALAVAFTFVSRGGLGLRVHGLTLVRGDGRPAGRFRCAWRTALLWAPFTALLVLSVFWSARAWGGPDDAGSFRWGTTLSALCWYAALALLPAGLALALRSPDRGWHDRLSGTWLVPR